MFNKHCKLLSLLLISIPLASMGSSAPTTDLESQRQLFKIAQHALHTNDLDAYEPLKAELLDYPLYPYLRYEELRQRLDQTSDQEVEDFLTEYRDTPLSYRLRGAWLKSLADTGRWSKFLAVYDGRKAASLQCQYYYALIKEGRPVNYKKLIKQVWQVGHSQPQACDSLFHWLERKGHLNSKTVWNRIYLAMEQGQDALARYLAKKLDTSERTNVKLWIRIHNAPARELPTLAAMKDGRLTRRIVTHGIKQLAEHDVDKGRSAWKQLKHRYAFSTARRNEIDRYIALLAAYRAHPQALNWFDQLAPEAITPQVRLWYSRTALRLERWDLLAKSIPKLDKTQRHREMWRYWLARGLEHIGEQQKAKAIYSELATKRDYYGFLAADRLDAPYAINNRAIVDAGAATQPLMDIPGILRAHELYRLGNYSDARAEWSLATRGFSKPQQRLAARLAHEWKWHETAVRMAAKSGELDDLELRFPAPFQNEVILAASEHALAPSLVYSIMRRESIFSEDARSPAGALGLMQLMPTTAKHTAAQLGLPTPQLQDLLSSDSNIELGTGYLRQLLDRFDNHLVLAVAAYNAGPNQVSNWAPENQALAADAWIDTIPFYETRRYLRAVLAYQTIYNWKLEQPCQRMSLLMRPVAKQDTYFAFSTR